MSKKFKWDRTNGIHDDIQHFINKHNFNFTDEQCQDLCNLVHEWCGEGISYGHWQSKAH